LIIAAPYAGGFTGSYSDFNTLKSTFNDRCTSNGFKVDKTYEILRKKKLIGFEYEQPKIHPYNHQFVLPDIKPIIIKRKDV
jgi:hypothetical protein